jgi:hypothetical protein
MSLTTKKKKSQVDLENKMVKQPVTKKEKVNNKFMFTDTKGKEVYLKNLTSEKDEETGYVNYSGEISESGEKFRLVEIGYLPKQLRTKIQNLHLKEDQIVLVKYDGLKESTLSNHTYHNFFVTIESEESESEEIEDKTALYTTLLINSGLSKKEIDKSVKSSIEKMHGMINEETALYVLIKEKGLDSKLE